jgi:death-on-curing protein
LLDSAMARPQNQFAYGQHALPRLATSDAFGISRNHPFLDSNKRASLVVAELILELNGLELAEWIAALRLQRELAPRASPPRRYAPASLRKSRDVSVPVSALTDCP